MTIFNSILHVVSEKIFEISANQRLLWPLAAILDNRSEQKVTTIDQNLVRNISTKYGSNTSSGSCKTNFFSRTTGWIGIILGRNVPY
jgi:hypothetical protein